mgnify:CR=1 FL=1|jgi:hypothetical protein
MEQKVVRTCKDLNYSNLKNLNDYLEKGWFVVMVNPIGNYLEYIIQINKK